MAEVFANSEDPDQTLHSATSDLGLHCLPITLLRVSDYNEFNKDGLDSPAYSIAWRGLYTLKHSSG